MLIAAVTFKQIVELLILIIIVHAVLLAPVMIAIIGAFGERLQNQDHQPRA
jgi:hypothetical protein